MRNGLLALVSTIALVWNASAQDQADHTKYELIRETINFLAADRVVSQDTNFRITCETLDYDCFKQQLSGNPIAGIERWYNSWRSLKATDEAGLIALRDQVFADIFDRPGKGYRKQLAGYQGYVDRIEQLINPPVDELPMEQIAEDTALIQASAESEPTPSEQLTERNDNEKNDTMIAYFALAIALIALIIAVLPILKKKEQQPLAEFEGLEELQVRLDGIALRMKRLEQKITDAQMADALTHLTQIMESVEKRVVELESNAEADTD